MYLEVSLDEWVEGTAMVRIMYSLVHESKYLRDASVYHTIAPKHFDLFYRQPSQSAFRTKVVQWNLIISSVYLLPTNYVFMIHEAIQNTKLNRL